MKWTARFRKKFSNYLFDHYLLKEALGSAKSLFYGIVSALLYAFGFCAFVTPGTSEGLTVVTGGVGGVAQNIGLIITMCGQKIDIHTLQSIFYFVVNVPILIFAFFCIGKRFAILSLINVGISSLCISFFNTWGFTTIIAKNPLIADSMIARVLFSGVFVGSGSAIAFKGDISAGGIDVFSYYFALRKSTSVGKYTVAINFVIISIYCILSLSSNPNQWDRAIIALLYSIFYLFTTMLVVDVINIRNKKVQIQIITNRNDISRILIANFPHSTTIMNAKGGYLGRDKYVVYMIVSSSEVNSVINLVRKVDENSFVSVTSLVQVYGKFFIKPVE